MIPIISIVGRTDCGKTTLIEKLIPEFAKRGYKVGTIKHDIHGFDIDHLGKDSWRHAQAGSSTVAISSPEKVALVKKVGREMTLDELVEKYFEGVDIILTEGYKRETKPKIEILRSDLSDMPLCTPEELALVASDKPAGEHGVPCYDLNDVKGMVDYIEGKFLSRGRDEAPSISLVVDGKDVPLKIFTRAFLVNSIVGMISSLRGVKDPNDIVLRISRSKRK